MQAFASAAKHAIAAGFDGVTAIAVGADSDNTRGTSLAYLTGLQWMN